NTPSGQAIPVQVKVQDSFGNGISGLPVTLTIGSGGAQVFDAVQDYSNTNNPNGAWRYGEVNALPSWLQLAPSGTPPPARNEHSAVYDPAGNRMILFGGVAGSPFNDTWVLSNANRTDAGIATWSQLSPSGSPPPARAAHSAVWDAATSQMIIFGGSNTPDFNDVWSLTATGSPTWTQLSPTGTPP